jgi:hypothetical protein
MRVFNNFPTTGGSLDHLAKNTSKSATLFPSVSAVQSEKC